MYGEKARVPYPKGFSGFLNGRELSLPYTTQIQTHSQVWIRLYGISAEYWHPRLLMEMARGVGTPLQLDPMTKEGRFGFYARVLVDVDLSKPLPESIMIEREGFAFPVEVVYAKFPPICDYCGIIGHSISSCRQNSKKKDSDTVSKSKVNQVYRVPELYPYEQS